MTPELAAPPRRAPDTPALPVQIDRHGGLRRPRLCLFADFRVPRRRDLVVIHADALAARRHVHTPQSPERRLWRVDAAAGRERIRVDSGEVPTSRDAKVGEVAEARTAEPAVSVDLDGEGRCVGGAARRRRQFRRRA